MKFFFLGLLLFCLAFTCGAYFSTKYGVGLDKGSFSKGPFSLKEHPISENKDFVIVVMAGLHQKGFERTLRSLAEQDYDRFRIIFLGEGESREVEAIAEQLGLSSKFSYAFSEPAKERMASLYQAIHTSKDEEIIVLLDANGWLAHEGVLTKLNSVYQDPEIWLSCGQYVEYPSYAKGRNLPLTHEKIGVRSCLEEFFFLKTFYAGLGKKIKLSDFFYHGKLLDIGLDAALMIPLLEMAGKRQAFLPDVLCIQSQEPSQMDAHRLQEKSARKHIASLPSYALLDSFRSSLSRESADLLVFSDNSPLQLYAFLESVQRYVSGVYRISALYHASDEHVERSYEKVKDDFIGIPFLRISTDDFKEVLLQTVFEVGSSGYILFARDDLLVKDQIDLEKCIKEMEETFAYGFYLGLGNQVDYCSKLDFFQGIPPHVALKEDLFAWDFSHGKGDFALPHALTMALYRKEALQKALIEMDYQNFQTLEDVWPGVMPDSLMGLYYGISKVIQLPFFQYASYELLEKFDEGMKVNVDRFFQTGSRSLMAESPVEFIPR